MCCRCPPDDRDGLPAGGPCRGFVRGDKFRFRNCPHRQQCVWLLLYCFKGGCSFVDIANAVDMPLSDVQIDFAALAERENKRATYTAAKLKKARELWAHAKPIPGTKAEKYLRGRGINCDLPDSLRFAPDLYHQPSTSWGCAMVADVSNGGVHRTFMDKGGNRLPRSAKMMLGPCAGGAVRLSQCVNGECRHSHERESGFLSAPPQFGSGAHY